MPEPTVATTMTTEMVAYLHKVNEWLKTAPKPDHDDPEEFWIGQVTVEWSHSEHPIAVIKSEEDWWLVEVTNG